jgi:hypothetical protein
VRITAGWSPGSPDEKAQARVRPEPDADELTAELSATTSYWQAFDILLRVKAEDSSYYAEWSSS